MSQILQDNRHAVLKKSLNYQSISGQKTLWLSNSELSILEEGENYFTSKKFLGYGDILKGKTKTNTWPVWLGKFHDEEVFL
jgi:hypothetical protein